MSQLSFAEAREKVKSMQHLLYATKDINYWEFTEEATPIGAPESMVCVYRGKDKKTGITQDFFIDRADIRHHGTLENVKKHIHRQFAKSLAIFGRAIDQARAQQSRLILPRHMSSKGAAAAAYKRLEAGDIDH